MKRRFGMLAMAALGCVGLTVAVDEAAGQSIWELTPYQVQVFLAGSPSARVTPRLLSDLKASLRDGADAYVGAAWVTEVVAADAAMTHLMRRGLEKIDVKDLPSSSLERDKVVFLYVDAVAGGLAFFAREFDVRTRQWGVPSTGTAAQAELAASSAVQTLLAAFSPLALVESTQDKTCLIRVRASGLPPRDPSLSFLGPGTVLRPVLRFNDRDGKLRADRPPQLVPWTYLTVEAPEKDLLRCRVDTGLRSPLTSRRRGRSEQLALGFRPPQRSSTLELHSRGNEQRRLFGYEVFAYSPDSPATTLLGRTDTYGRLEIPAAVKPLRILVIKSGGEFLAKLPLVPGLEPIAVAAVADDDERLAVEGLITGIQEEIVDIVARRSVLQARIRTRIDEGKVDEAQKLLEDMRKLRSGGDFAALLNEQRKKIFSSDARVQKKIDKLFSDTNEVVSRNLDQKQIDQISREVTAAKNAPLPKTAPAAKGAATGG